LIVMINFESANVVIVDGKYLCLLPNLERNNQSTGAKKKRQRESQSRQSEAEFRHIAVDVAAVPLSSAWKICAQRYISCHGKSESSTINIQADGGEENPLFDTIRLNISDLRCAEYRFVQSISLINGLNTWLPMHIGCDTEGDGILTLVEEGDMHVDVSLTGSPLQGDNKTDAGNILLGDESLKAALDGDKRFVINQQQNGSFFRVCGAGSCLVADFLGVSGYEQALLIPRVESDLFLNLNHGEAPPKGTFEQQTTLLQTILRHSIITDGQGLLTNHLAIERDDDGNLMTFTMPVLDKEMASEHTSQKKLPHKVQAQTPGQQDLEELSTNEEGQMSLIVKKEDAQNEQAMADRQEDPKWLKAIAETVEYRLSKEAEEIEQLERSARAFDELVIQGRKTLHTASRRMPSGTNNTSIDPEIIRLRYGTRPRSTSGTCVGISVTLDLEVDVLLRKTRHDEPSDAAHALQDFHLSCSYAQCDDSSRMICTQSGVAPRLQSGDCVTILASVKLTELTIGLQNKSIIEIAVQGLWIDPMNSNESTLPSNNLARQAAVLCILRMPEETLFLSPSVSFIPSSNHWIHHETDFTSRTNDSHIIPSVIFEHRHPRTIIIDSSFAQDSNMWEELIFNLNASIGGDNFIDMYCKKGDPRLHFVVFGSNPEERATAVKKLLHCLPESAKIVDEDSNKKGNVKALLFCLKEEADALKRHRAAKEVRPELMTETTCLQRDTDGCCAVVMDILY